MAWKESAKSLAKRAVVDVPTASVVGYWRGLTYPFKGMRFVFFQHPGLVRYWLWPILITIALLSLATWASWAWHADAVNWLWNAPTGAGFWASVGRALHTVVEIVVFLVLCTTGLLAVVFFTNVIAAPFNDFLSEEVEHLATTKEQPRFRIAILLRDAVRNIGLEIVKLVIYALVMGPLFLVAQLVPAIGHFVYSLVAFVFTAIYFAIDYVDWPASRRNRSIGYRFGMLKYHFMPMLGFGTGVWLFLFIPFLNLLFMPAAVAGGTLLFLELEGKEPERKGPVPLEPGTPIEDPMPTPAPASDPSS